MPASSHRSFDVSGEYVALPDGLNEPAALLSGVMDTARPPWR